MLPCHGRGRGFESRPVRRKKAPKEIWGLLYLPLFIMFCVYIIQSQADKSYYKGYSTDPLIRLEQHNNKESAYTSSKTPWKLVYIEILDNKTAALKRERVLKRYSHQQIEQLLQSPKNQLASFKK
jgi:putative endonuclease